jgi:hypothetical protein
VARRPVTDPAPPSERTPSPTPAVAPTRPVDDDGRFVARGRISYTIVGAYLFLLIVMLVLLTPKTSGAYVWVPYLLLAVTALFLARYLSTGYVIDDTYFRARRILGGRKFRLEEIRRIEYASLRDLVPISGGVGFGSWGWRGRLYSPSIGEFDAIYTDAAKGLLITAGAYPLYISPVDLPEFARELSRRARSYTGPLARDVGDPRQVAQAQ